MGSAAIIGGGAKIDVLKNITTTTRFRSAYGNGVVFDVDVSKYKYLLLHVESVSVGEQSYAIYRLDGNPIGGTPSYAGVDGNRGGYIPVDGRNVLTLFAISNTSGRAEINYRATVIGIK